MGILLCFCRICSADTDIIICRGCYIGGIICADPLILDLDSRYIGHPVGLSCRLALSNDQTLRHFPARDENAVLVRLCCRSVTARVRRITNKLRTDFGIFHRAIFTVDLNRFSGACARIRGDHIDITAFLGNRVARCQIDIVIRADLSIISQIEGSSYKNTVTFGSTSSCLSQRVVVVLDDAACHGISTTVDTAAYICNIVFNRAAGLFHFRASEQAYTAATPKGFIFGNRTAGNRYIRCLIQKDTATELIRAISR